MASSVPNTCISNSIAYPVPRKLAAKTSPSTARIASSRDVIALSVEFVAKPQEAYRVQSVIPSSLAGILKDVSGFAGCLVMVSDQEARLVTVVTL